MPDYKVRVRLDGYFYVKVKGAESADAAMDQVGELIDEDGYLEVLEQSDQEMGAYVDCDIEKAERVDG